MHLSDLDLRLAAVICLLLGVGAAAAAFVYRWKYRRLIRNIERMIDGAASGQFTEQTQDESVWSSVESRFSKLLVSLRLSERRAEQEHEMIREIISNISHQTKTPIANLCLYAELLAAEQVSDTAQQYIRQMMAQSEKLSFLTAALVDLSRLETGIIRQSLAPAQIMPMLSQIVQQYEPAAASRGLTLSLTGTDVTARFDTKWMYEALANIVDNAVKYTEQGSIRIRVIPYEIFVCIEISDTGTGIPEEEQAKVFQRFYRSPAFAGMEGLGIGLYIARQIVTSSGGYIRLQSAPGEGSVFSVFLPKETTSPPGSDPSCGAAAEFLQKC